MSRSADKGNEPPAAADPAVPTDPSSSVASPQRALLTVVRGEPTPEQLAALIAVVSARAAGGGDGDEAAAAPPLWSRPQLRTGLTPGPGAWRASALPR